VLVYLTIAPLRGQLHEARKQTEFTIGDAEPEFVILRSKRRNQIYMRVTNYNRRNVVITAFKLLGEQDIVITGVFERIKGESAVEPIFPPYSVEGWHDRNQPAPRRSLVFLFETDKGISVSPVQLMYREITVATMYRVVGQDHLEKVSTSTALPVLS
jgi:hypothetical protein